MSTDDGLVRIYAASFVFDSCIVRFGAMNFPQRFLQKPTTDKNGSI